MVQIGRAIDPGIKRRDRENQDYLAVIEPDKEKSLPPLLIIADGMGGYSGGEIASKLVVDTITNEFLKSSSGADYTDVLYEAVLKTLDAIRTRAQEDPNLSQMGSTVVAAIINDKTLHIVNVGDSRAYLVHNNEINLLSWDHSLVGDQFRRGEISAEEAYNHPRKNVLTMSLNGLREEIEPYATSFPIETGDIVILCSDGLWGTVTDAQIEAIVTEMEPQAAATKLVELANANQGPDNISVLIAKI